MEHVSLYFDVAFVVWFFVGFFVAVEYDWFCLSESISEFPFSLKRFFVMAFYLLCACVLCVFSAWVAHAFTVGIERSFLHRFFPLAASGWYAVEVVGSLSINAAGLHYFLAHVPPEYHSMIAGQSGGVKKWAKGAFFGVLFYPLIFSVAWVVGLCVSLFVHEPQPPQNILTFLGQLKQSPLLFWEVALSIIFLVPYIEELLFRGFLQSFLGGMVHPLLAVLITGLVFSSFHYSSLQKSSNFAIMSGLFVFSLLVSRLRIRENAVIASVGMHAGFNAVSLMLFSF